VIPKGWPIKGLKPHEVAAREAYEEAGLIGSIAGKREIGIYHYEKQLPGGPSLCEVWVFQLWVEQQLDDWPALGFCAPSHRKAVPPEFRSGRKIALAKKSPIIVEVRCSAYSPGQRLNPMVQIFGILSDAAETDWFSVATATTAVVTVPLVLALASRRNHCNLARKVKTVA
jgi:ADP-ribose pyrophosphatase YjhB (NUDIX family)